MSSTYQIHRKTRDAVILNLRRVFAVPGFKYEYRETATGEYDFDRTKVVISDVIPQEHAFFPCIVVNTVGGDESRYIGPDDLGDSKDINHFTQSDKVFASINLTVDIRIYTIDDTIARDEIVDYIYDHLKLITDDLADAGIEIKRTRFITDSRQFANDRWFITAGLSMEIYTEWQDDLGITNRVSSIPIQISLDLMP